MQFESIELTSPQFTCTIIRTEFGDGQEKGSINVYVRVNSKTIHHYVKNTSVKTKTVHRAVSE